MLPGMRRLTVMIPDDAAVALVRLAQAERRDPRVQAAVVLTQALDDIDRPDGDDRAAAVRQSRGIPAVPRPEQ